VTRFKFSGKITSLEQLLYTGRLYQALALMARCGVLQMTTDSRDHH